MSRVYYSQNFGPNTDVVSVEFDASNFGASGGTWIVGASDVATFGYWRSGRFRSLAVTLIGGTIAGNPGFLILDVPTLVKPIGSTNVGFLVKNPSTNPVTGFVLGIAGTSLFHLFLTTGNWTNGVTPIALEISFVVAQ